jgi:hypothetical protein
MAIFLVFRSAFVSFQEQDEKFSDDYRSNTK